MLQAIYPHDHNGDYTFGFDNKKDVKRRFQIIRTERNYKEAEQALAEIHALRMIHEAGGLSAMLAPVRMYKELSV